MDPEQNETAKKSDDWQKVFIERSGRMMPGAEFYYDFQRLSIASRWHKYCCAKHPINRSFCERGQNMRSFVIGLILIFGIVITLGYAYGG
jgi:hypothetical protein